MDDQIICGINMRELSELIGRMEQDNLMNKQRHVVERLATIRVGKKKILEHLQLLLEKEMNKEMGAQPELICRLVESFNGLKKQEEEFISAMRQIIDNYLQSIEKLVSKFEPPPDFEPKEKEQSNTANDIDTIKELESCNAGLEKLIAKFVDIREMLGDIKNILHGAEEASRLLDDQLKARLEIRRELKKKSDLLQQIEAKDKLQSQQQHELDHLCANKAKKEGSSLDRKQRQLERLRREVAKRGLINNNDSQVAYGGKQPQSTSESMQKGDQHSQHQNEEDQRIPPITQLPEQSTSQTEISEKKKDELRKKISEGFASLDARKQRMRVLRSKLNNMEQKQVNDTYEEALKRFKQFTEMRKKLEELQVRCTTNGEEIDKAIKIPPIDPKSQYSGTSTIGFALDDRANREQEENPPENDGTFEDKHSSVPTDE